MLRRAYAALLARYNQSQRLPPCSDPVCGICSLAVCTLCRARSCHCVQAVLTHALCCGRQAGGAGSGGAGAGQMTPEAAEERAQAAQAAEERRSALLAQVQPPDSRCAAAHGVFRDARYRQALDSPGA